MKRVAPSHHRILCLAIVIGLVAAYAPRVRALTDEELFRDFPFNLNTPGARALGVGASFISLADDSTAAQSNPAGLVNLRRPELFAEVRSSNLETSRVATAGTVNRMFFNGDLTAGATSSPETGFSPTFLSYVLPFERVAIGFSRLESLNTQTRTRNSFTIVGTEAIVDVDTDGNPVIIGTQPVDLELTAEADSDTRITQYNVAVAFEAHRRLALGLTAVVGQAELNGRADNLFRDPAASFPFNTLDYATRIDDRDVAFSYNAGMIIRPADWMNIGMVYRRGLQFELEERILPLGARGPQAQALFGESFGNDLRVPDSYGVGFSFRPAEPWTILVEAVHVEHSDLLDGFVSGLNRLTFPANDVEFVVDDGTEIHAGVERILLAGKTPWALRFGAWTEPDSRIRAGRSTDLLTAFPAGERTDHFTGGFGVTLQQSIQLDLAFDLSDAGDTVVFSTIFGF